MYEGVPCVVHIIRIACYLQGYRLSYGSCRADSARYVVAAIYIVYHRIACGVLSVDVHIGITTHVSHTGTAKHLVDITVLYGDAGAAIDVAMIATAIYLTTNIHLSLDTCQRQENHADCYGQNTFHFLIINYHSTSIVGLSISGSDSMYRYVGFTVRLIVYL